MEAIIRSINHIARLATLYREKELKKYGLGPMHHTYILNICRNPGISQDELAKMIFVNKSNVARQLVILEDRGYVFRKSCEQDARKMLIYPTEKATEMFGVISDILLKWNEQVLTGFSLEEQQKLIKNLEKLKENSQNLLEKEED
jgi:DNA-binding MarR family transcriptional regulator